MGPAAHSLPERQLVAVVVAVVEEAAVLDDEAARIQTRSIAAVPALRRLSGRLRQRFDSALDVVTLLCLLEFVVLDPPPSVTANVKAGPPDRRRNRRVALKCQRASKRRQSEVALLKQAQDPPEADAAPVLKHAFASEIATINSLAAAKGLRVLHFGIAFAVLYRRLGALLDIDDEVYGEARPIRPFGIRLIRTIPDEIANLRSGHRCLQVASRLNASLIAVDPSRAGTPARDQAAVARRGSTATWRPPPPHAGSLLHPPASLALAPPRSGRRR